MEFHQGPVTTIHDLRRPPPGTGVDGPLRSRDRTDRSGRPRSDARPAVDLTERDDAVGAGARLAGESAVVVPMTARDAGTAVAGSVLSELERLDPAAVVVALRAPSSRIEAVLAWLGTFDLDVRPLWCNRPALSEWLASRDLDHRPGKGLDCWLALGPAADAGRAVVFQDADDASFRAEQLARLLAPMTMEYRFVKAYYARVENDRLYGRLCRLCYEPLVRALRRRHDDRMLAYLAGFRYALAGEVAVTPALARSMRPPPGWGLEVATLGDAYRVVGPADVAQVDLGRHVHEHRSVTGQGGLVEMSDSVTRATLRVVESAGITPHYETLAERVWTEAERLVRAYEADAVVNGLAYDAEDERAQARRYASSISPPGPDRRLPAWTDASFGPSELLDRASVTIDRPDHRAESD